jgi:Mg2+/Co2+ transporter CorC
MMRNLAGKSRQDLEVLLRNSSREELLDIIESLASVEQLLKPAEIAARSCMNKRRILAAIRRGELGPYFAHAENSIAVPASSVNKWRRRFLVPITATNAD